MTYLARFTAILVALSFYVSAHAQDSERVLMFSMLRNGDFTTPTRPAVIENGIPWWVQRSAGCSLSEIDGKTWLLTLKEGRVTQPIPGYAPLTEGMVIRGKVRGAGRISLLDGLDRRATKDFGAPGAIGEFEWKGEDIAKRLGSAPMPRMLLELSASPNESAAWADLEVLIPLPCPTEEAMRDEIVQRLHDGLDPWIELSLDNLGPRKTGLTCILFDAITGERLNLRSNDAGFHPLMDNLFDAIEHEPDPLWVAAFHRFVEDFLELLIHEETGIPRMWNCLQDQPLNDRFLEIHVYFRFLLDLVERGPEKYRERALAAAEKMAETVLASGILPDGNVAALYRPRDGAYSNATRPLRRLDTPAEMTRLSALNGDVRLLEVARDAVATLLYTHYWPGNWLAIDPGFDDDFGHYAGRAAVMAKSFPDEVLFRRVVDSGWERFRGLWPQAIRYGGSMAADQVRCWRILIEYSELRPEIREDLDELLVEAMHSHLRGQQYGNGAWGDVTYFGFNPAVDLQVGDLPGTPSNLLQGLAAIYGTGLGPSEEELRALFTAVMRSSYATYGRKYGMLSTMREMVGANDAGGSLRIAPALTLMLAALSEE